MIVSLGARILARYSKARFRSWDGQSEKLQEQVFRELLARGRETAFGREHGFASVASYEDFRERVPVRDYEGIRPYIERIIAGEKDVLWPGRPLYFAKTSGTTSGAKFIPITRDSMPNHIDSARQALLMYILKTGNTGFLKGKYIFISGSPELERTGGILTGRLSGIVHHHIPSYLRGKRLPRFETNCIPDWEQKLDRIVAETATRPMSLISGIPPWVEMYFERLLDHTGQPSIARLFPGFGLLVHGGVNFEPYRDKLFRLIGKEVDALETYPASEGFIAFQAEFPRGGLVPIPDSGIFYEFIPAGDFHRADPPRLRLAEVEPGVQYVVVLHTNAGLWGYNIGDTVRFESVRPYRMVVSGRLSQYTSAFGEHVIGEEAEAAMQQAVEASGAVVKEFTLAPLVDNPDGKPCHQWFVEFSAPPEDIPGFAKAVDQALRQRNAYYRDLVTGHILEPAQVVPVPEGTFRAYMKSVGKLGGQNKVPHLSNDRRIADWISDRLLTG
jgi:hypothetical protein